MSTEADEAAEGAITRLRNRVEDAYHLAKNAMERVADVDDRATENEQRIRELEDELVALRRELDRVDDRTDLLRHVSKQANGTVDEHAAVLLQTLYNEATERGDADTLDNPTASLEPAEAVAALGGGLDYRLMYRRFDRAVELVDDTDVCWVDEQPRHADENTALKFDLRGGEMPAAVAGHELATEDTR